MDFFVKNKQQLLNHEDDDWNFVNYRGDTYTTNSDNFKFNTKISLITDTTWKSDDGNRRSAGRYSKIKDQSTNNYKRMLYGGRNFQGNPYRTGDRLNYLNLNDDVSGPQPIGLQHSFTQQRLRLRTDPTAEALPQTSVAGTLPPHMRYLNRYTKGKIYLFYKSNKKIKIKTGDSYNDVVKNIWYIVVITGKENAIDMSKYIYGIDKNEKKRALTVPYGHGDLRIADGTDRTDSINFDPSLPGAGFSENDDEYTDFTDGGFTDFSLTSIMNNPDSSAYAIIVDERKSSSGTGYVIEGSVFENSDSPINYVHYKKKYKR